MLPVRKTTILRYAVVVSIAGYGACASAATVNITTNSATTVSTTALTSFATTGGDMDGMTVTAKFSDGTSDVATWQTAFGTFGFALGTRFNISLDGDTSTASWLLQNTSALLLTGLTIDAGAGSSVFDLTNPVPGTAGSSNGKSYTDVAGLGGVINVNYFKAVALSGSAPVGDLFAVMVVDFAGLTGGGIPNNETGIGFRFGQDTDNLSIIGDLVPTAATPVPGAAFLMGSVLAGGAGFGAWRRKRKQAA